MLLKIFIDLNYQKYFHWVDHVKIIYIFTHTGLALKPLFAVRYYMIQRGRQRQLHLRYLLNQKADMTLREAMILVSIIIFASAFRFWDISAIGFGNDESIYSGQAASASRT